MTTPLPAAADIPAAEQLYTVLAAIPAGTVVTYGQLAALAGFPRRARWVGQMLHQLPEGSRLPWHRVINAQGRSSFPPGSPAATRQLALLQAEGVEADARGRISLQRFGLN